MSAGPDCAPFRLAIVAPHPVPYHSGLFKALHRDPRLEVAVYYLDTLGAKPRYNPDFGRVIQWDAPLLEGFPYRFLKNVSLARTAPFLRRVNPGLVVPLLFDRFDAVLVFGYSTVSAQLALWAAKLRGKRVFLKEEADLSFARGTGLKRILKERILPSVLRRFDGVLFSCRRNKDYFKHFGVKEDKLFPVLSSVDNRFLNGLESNAREKRAAIRAAHGIPPSAVVGLCVARHAPRKRPLDLLDAYEALAGSQQDFWLMLVGDGPLGPVLEERIRERGLRRVVLTGFKNTRGTCAHFMAADMFLLASETDATPKALNEAMVFGLPAVVSNGVGTAGDLVVHGLNGFVFDTGDVSALAGWCRKLVGDSALRERMSRAARKAAATWSPEANVEGVVAALGAAPRSMAASPRPGPVSSFSLKFFKSFARK